MKWLFICKYIFIDGSICWVLPEEYESEIRIWNKSLCSGH